MEENILQINSTTPVQSTNPPAQNFADTTVAPKKFPIFSVLLLIILTIVSVISVYLFLQVRELSMSQPVPSPSPTLMASTDPTSNWQIYESKESGITFKYPGDIFIYPPSPRGGLSVYLSSENNVDSPLGLSSDGIMINQIFYPNYKDKDINEVRSVIDSVVGSINDSPVQKGKLIKIKNVTENNLNLGVFRNIPQNDRDIKFFQAIWENNNDVYYIQLISFNSNLLDEHKDLFDQILSTITPTSLPAKFNCPVSGYIDCMPSPDGPKPACTNEAMDWYKANCPDFKGAAL